MVHSTMDLIKSMDDLPHVMRQMAQAKSSMAQTRANLAKSMNQSDGASQAPLSHQQHAQQSHHSNTLHVLGPNHIPVVNLNTTGHHLDFQPPDLHREKSHRLININQSDPNKFFSLLRGDEKPRSQSQPNTRRKGTFSTVLNKRMEEFATSNLITQLNGNINNFRHCLKRADHSNSGQLNANEFKQVLNKFGVEMPKEFVETIFNENSNVNRSDDTRRGNIKQSSMVDIGYTNGKSLPINQLADKLETLTIASQSSSRSKSTTSSTTKSIKDTRERRILKKVIECLEKQSDPISVFNRQDRFHRGWVKPQELCNGLKDFGANLTASEYSSLIDMVDLNRDKKISIQEFKTFLDNKLHNHYYAESNEKTQLIRSNPRYTPSYRSNLATTSLNLYEVQANNEISGNVTTEYDFNCLTQSKTMKRSNLLWSKLQSQLIANRDKINKSFQQPQQSQSQSQQQPVTSMSYQELLRGMHANGMPLGYDDTKILELELKRTTNVNELNHITMYDIAETLGTEITENPKTRNPILVDKREKFQDGGIFHGMLRADSHLSNPNYTSHIFEETPEANGCYKRNKKRQQVNKPSLPHDYEPSKFWQLLHSEKDILMPMPLMSFRDNSAYPKRHGHISAQQQQRSLATTAGVMDKRVLRSVDIPSARTAMGDLIQQTPLPARPSSAPAASRTAHMFDDLSHSASRWGTKPLSDYIHSKAMSFEKQGSLTQQTHPPIQLSDPEHPKNRYGMAENAIGVGSRTLRKQYDSSRSTAPPFALHY